MLQSIVIHDIPVNNIAAMERWYFRNHAPEICRRYGPWLTRHESFLPVFAPEEARAYGFYNWRVTVGVWRELPETGHKGTFCFSVPPVPPTVAYCYIPTQPTEDFLGHTFQPHEKSVLRWYILFKYPEGVSQKDGEDWFLNVHAGEVMKQPGLYRFFSYRCTKEQIPLPGTWPPNFGKGGKGNARGNSCWDRVCELWYETFDDWRKSVIGEPPKYTRPSWASYDKYPFLKPQEDFVSSFILERPNDEFLRDSRGYV